MASTEVAEMYVSLIQNGKKTIDDVPTKLQETVKKILKEAELRKK